MALKRAEPSGREKTWRHFKCTSRSKRGQSEKPTYYTIPTIGHHGKGKRLETEKKKKSMFFFSSGGDGKQMNRQSMRILRQ